ncbi:DUF4352 domain-containing protein [Periweissella cryptocerci]|uniref:DUF4352 domain-containing protein n=1 Tax=Periweissella cryptocerci TaxID=2506420 RepID=A0A4P6YSS0_9LACO|nr:DUF4352 domain-containing protein [Periweissella cryptocerci]QBO35764.1 DUF4352 domain-containing protein [Periweissella cryptocerci]
MKKTYGGIAVAILLILIGIWFFQSNKASKPRVNDVSYGVKLNVNSFSNVSKTSNHDIQNTTTPGKDKLVSVNITLTNTTKKKIDFDPSQFVLKLADGIKYQPYTGPIPSKAPFLAWAKINPNPKVVFDNVIPVVKPKTSRTVNVGFAVPLDSTITKEATLMFVGLNQGTPYRNFSLDVH